MEQRYKMNSTYSILDSDFLNKEYLCKGVYKFPKDNKESKLHLYVQLHDKDVSECIVHIMDTELKDDGNLFIEYEVVYTPQEIQDVTLYNNLIQDSIKKVIDDVLNAYIEQAGE